MNPAQTRAHEGAARPLAGRHIVVTRPAGQSEPLARAIRAAGGIPVVYPVLAIAAIEDKGALANLAARIETFDLAVFVSPNAVEHALATLLARRSWPSGVAVAGIGKSTERALARFGIHGVITPQGRFDSEALLEAPQLAEKAMRGARVLILRGDGGRELLGEALAARGATVEYAMCYRRAKPQSDPRPLLDLWEAGALDAVTLTSSEGLRNLWEMVGETGRRHLRTTALFIPHPRIAEQARLLGLDDIRLTGPGDEGLIGGLIAHFTASTGDE
ncbi:MAG TPA: uroporphyrinogen III synthase [Rhodocyclaceae bacterium]|nr:MAG: uroporphyrinogen III synthase [Betaproteobacteria bacterium CG2_30_68_42]PIX75175.1 MAG: uroporphyrinogen III synthase [Rhodocyclales bacterium CG_4_10_14_3_um_filter_68_10]PJA58589.1 MAG: uroporphyrinogen III synthase [Rhodocyclales bacterium CG_4_9_14_3_um_filter_68_10]HCX32367.1 uroporphyrinogen III synthase [Rhodocyclaceae bacterium]